MRNLSGKLKSLAVLVLSIGAILLFLWLFTQIGSLIGDIGIYALLILACLLGGVYFIRNKNKTPSVDKDIFKKASL